MAGSWNEIKNNFKSYADKLKVRLLKALAMEATISKDENFAQEGRPKWKSKFIDNGNPLLLLKGRLQRETTVSVDLNAAKITIGNSLVYAKLQHEGGKIKITPKMRKFFWAKYFETKNKKWMMLALTSRTYITIPARPYALIPKADYGRVRATMAHAAGQSII